MTSVIFDSKKYIRKVPTKIDIVGPQGSSYLSTELVMDRVVIRETEFYTRVAFYMTEGFIMDRFANIINKYCEYKATQYPEAYLSIRPYPQGMEVNDYVLFFISNTDIGYFDPYETVSQEKIFTTYIDEERYAVINGEKHNRAIYDNLLKKENGIKEEEQAFIKEMIEKQASPDWFPTEKDFKETKKKLDKDKKKKESSDNGTLEKIFGVKKKKEENVQTAVVGESGEFINPKSLKIHTGSTSPDYELDHITGLDNIKSDIKKMQHHLEYNRSRESRGIKTSEDASLHMCFMGNPGTGKTTIARIMTGIMYDMKYIKKNQCIEISGLDLMGGYVGQTAIITKQIVDMARGGILFIDEAYALCENKGNDYGKEAVSVLLKEMEDNRGDLIVIFAGYEDDMNKFLDINQGFRSRINKYFDFVNYTTLELGHIFVQNIKKMHLKIDEPSLSKCMLLFKEACEKPNFSNGRFVRNLSEQIEEQHILNVADTINFERIDTITSEDIPDQLIERMLYGI